MVRVALVGPFPRVRNLTIDYVYMGLLDIVQCSPDATAKEVMRRGQCDVVVMDVRQALNFLELMNSLFLYSPAPKHIVLVADDPADVEVKSSHAKISVVTTDHLAAHPDLVMEYTRS